MVRLLTLCAGLCAMLASCQTKTDLQPAKLDITSSAQADSVIAVLADALGHAVSETVPANMSGANTLSVPPPQLSEYETRSPAKPAVFDVMIDSATCVLVERATGEVYPLWQVSCSVADE